MELITVVVVLMKPIVVIYCYYVYLHINLILNISNVATYMWLYTYVYVCILYSVRWKSLVANIITKLPAFSIQGSTLKVPMDCGKFYMIHDATLLLSTGSSECEQCMYQQIKPLLLYRTVGIVLASFNYHACVYNFCRHFYSCWQTCTF